MAEYVCHALIRHFREFDAFEADTRAGNWSFRKPRLRSDFPVGVLGLGVLGARVARMVAQFEFAVNGSSRTAKKLPGVRCFAGAAQLDEFLGATNRLHKLPEKFWRCSAESQWPGWLIRFGAIEHRALPLHRLLAPA